MKILSVVAAMIFFAVGAIAQTTNDLSDAEIQGRNLARQLLEQTPATNFVQNGVFNIRDGKGNRSEIPFQFQTTVTAANWCSRYETVSSNRVLLIVIHEMEKPNHYALFEGLPKLGEAVDQIGTELPNSKTMIPFANSDFWIADLGLEFFHWPEQKILKKENRRSRACNVLESTNPNPSTNGYSRVDSWIDEESGGIVHAEAYNAQNKLLKVFDPKSFKKVNGQWELQEMEIRNVQTGSRSRIEFDLKKE
jgi:hypothetical protein